MEIRSQVLQQLKLTVEEFTPVPFPTVISDEMPLHELYLDSIAFTNLLVGLEREVGFIPSGILQGVAFPSTIGELFAAYEREVAEFNG